MKLLQILILSILFSSISIAQVNLTLRSNLPYSTDLNDIWGYVTPTGEEYAIVGKVDGVSFVEVTDPDNPIERASIDGGPTIWRDIKTHENYAYVTTESQEGVLVVDLSYLPDSVSSYHWEPIISGIPLKTCHNLYIDDGYAYLAGCSAIGGVVIVDLADPGNPTVVHPFANYAHDVFVRGDTLYSSEINEGQFTVYDVADKMNPILLANQSTPYTFTHHAWLSDDSQVIYTADEEPDAPITSYDISDLTAIKELDQFRPFASLGEGVVPHNVFVWNDYLIVSYYTDGCILVDAARPDNLIEVGNFDTYAPAPGGIVGAWGAYPYLPSGNILVSDITNGLFVLTPNYVRACYLEGKITDANNGNTINDASIEILNTPVFSNSNLIGGYKTGIATAGTYNIRVSKSAYISQTVEVMLNNGDLLIKDFQLVPETPFAISGTVRDAQNNAPIANAPVRILNNDFDYLLTTNANGIVSVPDFFSGDYEIIAGKWGHKTKGINMTINTSNASFNIALERGIEDPFALDLGWTVEGNATQGIWERGEPIAVLFNNIPVIPDEDIDTDVGSDCFLTGNVANLDNGSVIGMTRLISPEFDLTNYLEPRLSFEYLFFSIDGFFQNGYDTLLVKMDTGSDEVILERIPSPNFDFMWMNKELDLSAYNGNSDLKIIFEINNTDSDKVEVAIDYFRIYDNDPSSIDVINENIFQMSAYPNPSTNNFVLTYQSLTPTSNLKLNIFNTLGQQIETLNLKAAEGQISIGANYPSGIYLANIFDENGHHQTIRIVKQ